MSKHVASSLWASGTAYLLHFHGLHCVKVETSCANLLTPHTAYCCCRALPCDASTGRNGQAMPSWPFQRSERRATHQRDQDATLHFWLTQPLDLMCWAHRRRFRPDGALLGFPDFLLARMVTRPMGTRSLQAGPNTPLECPINAVHCG